MMSMMSDYERNYFESLNKGPDPININDKMSESEKNLEILRYIKGAIRNQPISYGGDIEKCDAFLDNLIKENEINAAWEKHELLVQYAPKYPYRHH